MPLVIMSEISDMARIGEWVDEKRKTKTKIMCLTLLPSIFGA